jgi:hypothetical protein
VKITVIDRLSRKQYSVEPRKYEGRLLHQLPNVRTPLGDIYAELFLNEPSDGNAVSLFRNGTRVIGDIALLDEFARPPWTLRCLQGHLDAPFVNLTPGTRTGLVHDASFAALIDALKELEPILLEIIENQRRAEDERTSQDQLRTIQRAFREALLALPAEEYDWFDIQVRAARPAPGNASNGDDIALTGEEEPERLNNARDKQRQFFEFAGPLFSVAISPASSVLRVGTSREFRALARDRSRRRVEQDLEFQWQLVEGAGSLEGDHNQAVLFHASDEPGLSRLKVIVRQRDVICESEALVTVTHEILERIGASSIPSQGLPGYTFERAPGESWRSRFDAGRHVIVVNNGHRDFVYALRNKALKLRYLVRLFAKELVLRNFVGLPSDQLLERMVELSLRTEEHL